MLRFLAPAPYLLLDEGDLCLLLLQYLLDISEIMRYFHHDVTDVILFEENRS